MHLRFYEAPEKQTQKRYEPQVQAKGAAFCDVSFSVQISFGILNGARHTQVWRISW